MDFASLHNKIHELKYAEAIVQMRPSVEGYRELAKLKKEIKQMKREGLKVAN